jgi:hypothetical protein
VSSSRARAASSRQSPEALLADLQAEPTYPHHRSGAFHTTAGGVSSFGNTHHHSYSDGGSVYPPPPASPFASVGHTGASSSTLPALQQSIATMRAQSGGAIPAHARAHLLHDDGRGAAPPITPQCERCEVALDSMFDEKETKLRVFRDAFAAREAAARGDTNVQQWRARVLGERGADAGGNGKATHQAAQAIRIRARDDGGGGGEPLSSIATTVGFNAPRQPQPPPMRQFSSSSSSSSSWLSSPLSGSSIHTVAGVVSTFTGANNNNNNNNNNNGFNSANGSFGDARRHISHIDSLPPTPASARINDVDWHGGGDGGGGGGVVGGLLQTRGDAAAIAAAAANDMSVNRALAMRSDLLTHGTYLFVCKPHHMVPHLRVLMYLFVCKPHHMVDFNVFVCL